MILFGVLSKAQGPGQVEYQKTVEIVAVISTFIMVLLFILALFKRIFDHRLKNKVIDKQVTENMALSILGDHIGKEGRFVNVKWFAILAGIGAGLLIVDYTRPLGIHSLAIMFLSIAFSFLGYHLFLSMQNKNKNPTS